jgi:trehalose-6-phosphate synthase
LVPNVRNSNATSDRPSAPAGSQNEFVKPIIIASIDESYHPISGLKNKLLSYQIFLQRYPGYQNKIVLIQFVYMNNKMFFGSDQNSIDVIKKNRERIHEIRDQIHKEFGNTCLILQESMPSVHKRLALWTHADIILCSSLKDGLNLPILEYVKCKLACRKFATSTMISSEFAGCNEAMRGVLVYNPFSATEFLETMDKALSLTSEEREENMKLAYQYVKNNSVTKWTEEFLKDLKLSY